MSDRIQPQNRALPIATDHKKRPVDISQTFDQMLAQIVNLLNGDGTSLDISGIRIAFGDVAPAGVVEGSPGDLYIKKTATAHIYLKQTGDGTTAGWTLIL